MSHRGRRRGQAARRRARSDSEGRGANSRGLRPIFRAPRPPRLAPPPPSTPASAALRSRPGSSTRSALPGPYQDPDLPDHHHIQFHVIYWESSQGEGQDRLGVAFDQKVTRAHPRSHRKQGPALCGKCTGAVDVWRFRLDATHAAFRSLAKEGSGFREEVEDFCFVSPEMISEHNLQRFRAYTTPR